MVTSNIYDTILSVSQRKKAVWIACDLLAVLIIGNTDSAGFNDLYLDNSSI